MTIAVGDKLPQATLYFRDADGAPGSVTLEEKTKGRKVVIFSLPGPFTPTCSQAHMPSFVRTADEIRAKGVDEIICIVVNDIHVAAEWAKQTGADDAGITMLVDTGDYSNEIGLAFTVPQLGFFNRPVRYAMIVEDGEVTTLNLEEDRGACNFTAGEAIRDLL
ncbi:MAG: peroxiredoxin [Rhodobacteraceae bacterium]|nr:peroxiredoxin [Paracoccaceae bacterium]